MMPLDPRIIDLGIKQRGVLPLRIGALSAESSKASRDRSRWQPACNGRIGGQSGDVEGIVANRKRILARRSTRKPETRIQHLVRTEEMRVPRSHLLIVNLGPAIGLPIQGQGNCRVV